ncbi:unnamed protein product [Gongylonema pulchrum]|uniref:AP-3 complex subunit delta n=1 Tax=Gongylonema pulchrum TaxID=637853 RepID=A0A183EG20_9BILA|nr:unnamed protein product [Gongylonema pulchrum]
MGRILQTHPKAVQAHKDIVLRCLDDRDESIRLRALDLLYGMVSKRNIMEIVRKLMDHVDAAEGSYYRDELLSRIISICSTILQHMIEVVFVFRALDLLYGMVSKRNIMEIVRKLMDHVDAAEGSYYRDELLSRIISICSYNNYQYITNFEWYLLSIAVSTSIFYRND